MIKGGSWVKFDTKEKLVHRKKRSKTVQEGKY